MKHFGFNDASPFRWKHSQQNVQPHLDTGVSLSWEAASENEWTLEKFGPYVNFATDQI